MSLDFRRGMRPTGAYEWAYVQIEGLPHAFVIDHTEATVPSYAAGYLQIPGTGDLRRVPKAVAGLMYGREWDLQISLSGPDGLTAEWGGTMTRGLVRSIAVDPLDNTEEGTELTTVRDAWSARVVPPETEEPEYLSPETRLEIDGEEGDTQYFSRLIFTPHEDLIYFAKPDVWALAMTFQASINDGSFGGLSASVESAGSTPDTEGLTICGSLWTLTGSGVTAFTASLKTTLWLG